MGVGVLQVSIRYLPPLPPTLFFEMEVSSLNLEPSVSTTPVGGWDLPVPSLRQCWIQGHATISALCGSGDLNTGSSTSG